MSTRSDYVWVGEKGLYTHVCITRFAKNGEKNLSYTMSNYILLGTRSSPIAVNNNYSVGVH